jgi:outer membrane protein assembly factor BamB
MPRRRALLSSLGGALVAGCVGDDGATPTRTRTESTAPRTETDSPTETDSTDSTDTPGRPEPPDRIDADWPHPGHDRGNSNRVDATGPTGAVGELWSVSASADLSQPVLADGTLYVGSRDGGVLAYDGRTGEERWQQSVGDVALTPRVVAGVVCVPTSEAIVGLQPSDGSELWRTDTPGRADSVDGDGNLDRATLLAGGDALYWIVGEGEHNDENPTVVSAAAQDGSERWRTDIEDPWSRRLFASEDTLFVSTNHNAPVPWRLDTGSGEVMGRPSGPGADFEDEYFYRDGTLYSVGPIFGPVEATPVDDDGRDWEASFFGRLLSGGRDAVYGMLSDDDQVALWSLSTADGTERWSVADISRGISRPVVADECVLLRTEEELHCFDTADGTERWRLPGERVGERVVVVDDLFYTTWGETVRAFR